MMTARRQMPLKIAFACLVCATTAALQTGFVYCPAYPCQCESRGGALAVNCRHLFLSSLPKFLSFSGRIKDLSLSHNSIRQLPANGFTGLHIHSIDLLHNIVSSVHPTAFSGLESSLTSLSLQMYAYMGLPLDALSGLEALTRLIIRGCRCPRLQREFFKNLTSLEELHLVGCRIRDIAEGTFNSMLKLRYLNLADNLLNHIFLRHANTLPSLQHLDLSSNRVESLDSEPLWVLPKLKSLNFSKNKMSSVSEGVFNGMGLVLEELNLYCNQLSETDLLSLKNLHALNRLDLSDNNISNLSQNYFRTLTNLHHLRMANNNLCALPSTALHGLEDSLKHLDLEGNPLSVISHSLFDSLRYLDSLNISNTKIGGLHGNTALEGLKSSLSVLDVSNSGLVTGDVLSLLPLGNLAMLNLSRNVITRVDVGLFKAWPNLRSINLSYNNISVLTGSFSKMLDLEVFDLSRNSIHTIQECTMFEVRNMKRFALNHNPLSCTCMNLWLFLWYQSQEDLDDEPWRCQSPNKLTNRPFTDLRTSDFECLKASSTEPHSCSDTPRAMPSFSFTESGLSHIRLAIDILQNCSIKIHWHAAKNEKVINRFKIVFKLQTCSDEENLSVMAGDTVMLFPEKVTEHMFPQTVVRSHKQVCVQALDESSDAIGAACRSLGSCLINCVTSPSKRTDDHLQKAQLEAALRDTILPIMLICVTCSLALGIMTAVAIVCVCNSKTRPYKFMASPFWARRRSNCFHTRSSLSSVLPLSNTDSFTSEQTHVLSHTRQESNRSNIRENRQTSAVVADRHCGLNGQYLSYNMTRDLPKIETSRNFLRPTLIELFSRQHTMFDSVSHSNRLSQSEPEDEEFYFFF